MITNKLDKRILKCYTEGTKDIYSIARKCGFPDTLGVQRVIDGLYREGITVLPQKNYEQEDMTMCD